MHASDLFKKSVLDMPISTNILGSFLSFSSWVSQLWNHWRLGTRFSFLWRAVLHGRFFSSTCVLCLLDVAYMPFSTSDNQKYLHMFLNILGRQKCLCENNRCPCENYFFRGICYPEASVFLPAEVNLFPIWVCIPTKQIFYLLGIFMDSVLLYILSFLSIVFEIQPEW